jgi:hypothetical protein
LSNFTRTDREKAKVVYAVHVLYKHNIPLNFFSFTLLNMPSRYGLSSGQLVPSRNPAPSWVFWGERVTDTLEDHLWQDVKYTVVSVSSVATDVAANTKIFVKVYEKIDAKSE